MANERHRGRYQEYLAGAGQKIPNKQYAKKAKVGESDGLVDRRWCYVHSASTGPCLRQQYPSGHRRSESEASHPAHMYAIVALSTVTIMCTILSI
jgi:hypothetical protein